MTIIKSDAAPRNVVILGVSGSIGIQTVDVIERNPELFALKGAVVGSNEEHLIKLQQRHKDMVGVITNAPPQNSRFNHGLQAVYDLIEGDKCDIVVNGIVGAAGLIPTLKAIDAGRTVILANKEPLVMAGELVRKRLKKSVATLLPIDSEHNAIFQCLPLEWQKQCARLNLDGEEEVRRVILTGSGGAFRNRPLDSFDSISVADATAHPNWAMGPKVTVDSATMMNKGLEYIEACVLFGITSKKLEVTIHPQSIVHSMVEYRDGSLLAQLGAPDMRIPIANALNWPQRCNSGANALDFTKLSLDFNEVDFKRYPCLKIAIETAESNATSRVALNASNEVAVTAFLNGEIQFNDIARIVSFVVDKAIGDNKADANELDSIIDADQQMRIIAQQFIKQL